MDKIWEKQPKEGIKPYEAFCLYRDMGSQRSIKAVSKKLGKYIHGMELFSKNFSWVKRVNAYDRYLGNIKLQEKENRIIEALTRHADVGELFQTKAIEVLKQLDINSFIDMTPIQLCKLFEMSVDIERKALGIPLVSEEVRLNQAQDKLDLQIQIIKEKKGDGLEESSGFIEGIENIGKNLWEDEQ